MNIEQERKIDRIFHKWQLPGAPGGQIIVRLKGETVYHKCFGCADIETGAPMTFETVCHVASVSKQFTVMAGMLLQEEGRFDYDADLRTYIPELVGFPDKVTPRQLAQNISGVKDMLELCDMRGTRNVDDITREDALAILARQKSLNFPAGSRFMYSNGGYAMLAAAVEAAAGEDLQSFLARKVFGPLGMTHTSFRQSSRQVIPGRALSWWDDGTGYKLAPLNYGTYGATSLHTTAEDLIRWIDNYREPKICRPETIAEMFTLPELPAGEESTYCCGIRVESVEGHRYIRHCGEDAAYRALTMRFLDDDLDIAIVANTQNTYTEPAGYAIAEILLGLTPRYSDTVYGGEPETGREAGEEIALDHSFREEEAAGFYCAPLPDAVSIPVRREGEQLLALDELGWSPLVRERENRYRMGRLDIWLHLGPRSAWFITPEGSVPLTKMEPGKAKTMQRHVPAGSYYSEEVDALYKVCEREGIPYLYQLRKGESRLWPLPSGAFAAEWFRYCEARFEEEEGRSVLYLSDGRSRNIRFVPVTW